MAKYPDSIYEPREKEQRSGVEYVPEKKSVIFVEDVKKLDDEVVAIETDLIERIKHYPKRATMWQDEANVISGSNFVISFDDNQIYKFLANQDAPYANGDSFSNSFYLKAGTYIFSIFGLTADYCGKVDWYIDGVKVVSAQDWYSLGGVYNVYKSAEVVITSDGYHKLVGTVNGKNPSSSNYVLQLTKFWLKPATDPARE